MAKHGERTKWEDTTCYKQGERRGGAEPRSWALPLERLCILVHRCRGEEGQWFLSCYHLGIERMSLGEDLAVAKTKAVDEVKIRLWVMISDVDNWKKGADK